MKVLDNVKYILEMQKHLNLNGTGYTKLALQMEIIYYRALQHMLIILVVHGVYLYLVNLIIHQKYPLYQIKLIIVIVIILLLL